MLYSSTRSGDDPVRSAQVILAGLAPDGGLYVPETIPRLSLEEIEALGGHPYPERARRILSLYLDDFPPEVLRDCIAGAYESGAFDTPEIAPVHTLAPDLHVLELWHGPTCAFKDLALQILPHLLRASARIRGDERSYVILTATSGDTGKAALAGFRDIPGTRLVVFYPAGGVSRIQELQMVTQDGANLGVIAVRGNFDDTQTGVKQIFSDPSVQERLRQQNACFSSANSINWGRLVPQVAYYFSCYATLRRTGALQAGDTINFVVPTGNFGNILAGWLAREMGLPIRRLVCAANRNHILTDFIRTGVYDRNRAFHRTLSPSMDILISSNLERLLYLLDGRDAKRTAGRMDELRDRGSYRVRGTLQERISEVFWSDSSDDAETVARIRTVYRTHNYLLDTHTAVAMDILEKYREQTRDPTPAVVVSTASPFKFAGAAADAILTGAQRGDATETGLLEILSRETGLAIPAGLRDLDSRPVLHDRQVDVEGMRDGLFGFLGEIPSP